MKTECDHSIGVLTTGYGNGEWGVITIQDIEQDKYRVSDLEETFTFCPECGERNDIPKIREVYGPRRPYWWKYKQENAGSLPA
jgi:hypothetical protein